MYFNNIIGQSFAKKYIMNSINKDKINHAYLFEGIDGVGKITFAKEFAKHLLKIEHLENSPDYINIEPQGASIKIAQIRNLQTDVIIKPHGDYKIYVINNAEKMTIESQNALLKTLEEPPVYVIIILITNNKNSLLDTIKSRCDIVKFLPIPSIELKKYLEDRGIEEKKASILSTFSRGSISKALELSDSSDFMIMREDIQNYIQIMLEKNVVDILELPNKLDKYKDNILEVLDITINYFRDIMMIKENIDKSMIINIDKITYLQNMSKKINYSQVSKIIDIIEETKKKLRSNCNFNLSVQVMALNIYEVIK
ncbi:MAG: AAA family ATPase [Paeniclostridium sp.]|uniref:DNA polymerase III subunit n=1 Tax=Paraclostridium sordellii TaxID=1505 RepID=UPI0005DEDCE0|nr:MULTISPECIES: DNA polymerase III subunit delta' C-terminal domain-containing protein [Paeniclostridium]MBW4863413.1 AAA family ATPase [Paeniclostridium sp.]MBW4873969.1 AAA family ATPase [Paeniclostridium sp.]CEN97580.1 DNA polymerase III subunit delta' [[Clostridium] sordellii] [Paeniclostridium sordellii]CEN98306.1 DNA polymerase III subunit delta' [[Clostridium] sordellii] [Paeniclostridium sordellii]